MKGRRRQSVEDLPMGPQGARSTVLSVEEEACVLPSASTLSCRSMTVPYALQASIPHLTRSSLHRLFQHHDISRLPSAEGEKAKKHHRRYARPFRLELLGSSGSGDVGLWVNGMMLIRRLI